MGPQVSRNASNTGSSSITVFTFYSGDTGNAGISVFTIITGIACLLYPQ
jgi:hypothetical protein